MVFIYWGWDTAPVNEETKDKNKTPGRGHPVHVHPAVHHALVIISMQSFAGIKTTGNGLGNVANVTTCCRSGQPRCSAPPASGSFHPPAAAHGAVLGGASAQATILPTAGPRCRWRCTRRYRPRLRRSTPLPHPDRVHDLDGRRVHRRLRGVELHVNGIGVIGDAVIAIGLYIAFYYGLTGFACTWYYRRNLTSSARNLWMRGILPSLGGLILFFLGAWSVWLDYDVATANDYTMWTVPIIHWQIGGAF
jgi:hypothetical protein